MRNWLRLIALLVPGVGGSVMAGSSTFFSRKPGPPTARASVFP